MDQDTSDLVIRLDALEQRAEGQFYRAMAAGDHKRAFRTATLMQRLYECSTALTMRAVEKFKP